MTKIDLHMHSNTSDGELTPTQLVDVALKKKIPVIAITDHNTTKGVKEALEYAKGKNIEIIPGIEITITPPKECKELHMVGLFINPEDTEIEKIHGRHRKYAEKVVRKIIKKLNSLGYEITFEELLNETPEKHLARPFIARILIRKYPNKFKDRKDVFNKLLGKRGKAFVRPKGTPMKEAIEIIHNASGISIVAHPCFLGEKMEDVIKKFMDLGGDGIERDFIQKSYIPRDMGERLDRIIEIYNPIISSGTDFHGNKEGGSEIGDRGLSMKEFDKLKSYYKDNINRRHKEVY